MNQELKRVYAGFMISVIFLLFFVPMVLPLGTVSAQSGYSIISVDHTVEVMYTGQILIRDTIHVSGQVTDGFMIGLPSTFSSDILKVVAYDDNNSYQVNTGVQLGGQSGFYGVSVDFNGNTPSVFTVSFILSSNSLNYETYSNYYSLDYPAYPSLTQSAAACNVTITLPSNPGTFNITKSDGFVDGNNYGVANLAAYTDIEGLAYFDVAYGTLDVTSINQLTRNINISPSGAVSVSDSYNLMNIAAIPMTSFVVGVPTSATNVLVRDQFGRSLTTEVAGTISYGSSDPTHDASLVNATLVSYLTSGQSTILTADYNLPSATLQGSQYSLNDFRLYPDFFNYVYNATFTFNPPEGATIVSPKLSSVGASSTLTRNSFQDTLTISKSGISYEDYNIPDVTVVQFSYDYNPVWASFRPTFWLSSIAAIGCGVIFFYRRRKSTEKEETAPKTKKLSSPQQIASTQQMTAVESVTAQRISADDIKEFTEAYEEKKQLVADMKSLESRAQKGKIPRRQYKVQLRASEVHLEAINKHIDRLKQALRNSGSANADLVKQLDSAEEDLADADGNIKSLDSRQKTGEISLETYKEDIGDYQKQKEKAESAINGILLRLREKTR